MTQYERTEVYCDVCSAPVATIELTISSEQADVERRVYDELVDVKAPLHGLPFTCVGCRA